MSNDALLVLHILFSLSMILFAFKLGRVWLMSLIAIYTVLMNIFVIKHMTLFGLDIAGASVFYASIFLGTDLLSEHFGKKDAYKAVRIGFFASIVFLIMTQFMLAFIPNDLDVISGSLMTVFDLTPRIIIAVLLSYPVSQHLDVCIYHWIMEKTHGKHLWLRNNVSTAISQGTDVVIFGLIAFWGRENLLQMIGFTFIIRVIIAAIDTPFLYLSKIKALEPEELTDGFFGKLKKIFNLM